MQYLKIENNGHVEAEDLMLIGSSTKREDSSKIGMFGSGWKYALAWFVRNEVTPIIFSGENEIGIDTEIVLHRDNPVSVLTVNGLRTSITSEMGMKWDCWMALREVISNAIDEGGYKMETVVNVTPTGEDGKTIIYIPINSDVAQFTMNYSNYFCDLRKPSFTCEHGSIFMKSDESKLVVYRKGIRCIPYNKWDNTDKYLFDFDLADVEINESRVADRWDILNEARKILGHEDFPPSIMRRLLSPRNEEYLPTVEYGISKEKVIEHVKAIVDSGFSVGSFSHVKAMGDISKAFSDIFIPDDWYQLCVREGVITSMAEQFDGVDFFVDESIDVRRVKYLLGEFNIDCDVKVGDMNGTILYDSKRRCVAISRGEYNYYLENDDIFEILIGRIIKSLPNEYFSQVLKAS